MADPWAAFPVVNKPAADGDPWAAFPLATPNPPPQPDLPGDPVAPAPLSSVLDLDVPQGAPVAVPADVAVPAPMQVPQTDPALMDKSTAAGDLEAGMLQLQQVIPALRSIPGVRKMSDAQSTLDRMDALPDTLRAEIAEVESTLNFYQGLERQAREARIQNLRDRIAVLESEEGNPIIEENRVRQAERRAEGASSAAPFSLRLAELQAEINKIPMNPAARDVVDPQGDGFWEKTGDALSSLASDPVAATRSLFLRSAPQLIPVAAASVAGFVAGGPVGAAAAGGTTGGALEMGASFSQDLLQVLKEQKIDPKDQSAVTAFLTQNPQILDEALSDASTRAAIIGGMDAASGGLVGRLASAVSQSSRGVRMGAAAGGGVVETATEGAGEAAAQAATEGEVNPGDVLAEMIGAGPVGAVSAGAQVAIEADKTPGRVFGRELGKLVEQAMLDATPVVPSNEARVAAPMVAPGQPEPPVEDTPPDVRDRGSIPRTVGADGPVDAAGSAGTPVGVRTGDEAGSNDGVPVFATRRGGGPERSGGADNVEGRISPASGDQRVDDLNGEELSPTEQAPAEPVFPAEPEKPQKKPLTTRFWKDVGQIDPDSDLARELYAQDITPKTARGLFAKGGLKNFDNIPANEHPEIAQVVGEDGNGYLDPRGLTDALIAEQASPAPIGRQLFVQQDYKAWQEQVAAIERGEVAEQEPAYTPPQGLGNWSIPPREKDISTGMERLDTIDAAINAYASQAGWQLTPQERDFVVDRLDRFGGPVEAAIERMLIEDIGYAETGRDAPQGETGSVPAADQRDTERSEDTAGPEGQGETGAETDGRARQGTTEGGRVDLTPEGEQTVIPGAEKITDKELAQRKQEEPKRGGDAAPPAGGLFDEDAKNQGQLFDASARVGRRPKGGLAPSFLEFSYTTRRSVYRHAFEAAGIDPAKGELMPLDEQLRVVSKAVKERFGINVELPTKTVVKKNRFGRKVAEQRTSLNERKALDQLLNAYRQLQMLAHMMAMPEKAIGLPIDGKPITLSLVGGNRAKGALGMYSYGGGKRVITLPDMSNSFAHEWAHALDHYLGIMSDKPMLKGLLSRDGRLTGTPLSPKRALTEAFAHVIWSMYGKTSQAGAIVLNAQVESAQLGTDGKPTPKAKAAQKLLNDMRDGKTPPADILSNYAITSKAYDDQVGGEGYFTDPAEMFARAFEAMIGVEVAKVSDQPQAFLSKGEWAYADSDDTRAALTFPKEVDLAQFTVAMTHLTQAMNRINLHGPYAPARAPDTHDIISTRDLLKQPKQGRVGSVTSKEAAEWHRTFEIMWRFPDKAREIGEKITSGIDAFYSQVIRTAAATMFAVADRQTNPKAKEAFTNIAKAVGKRPGAGMLTTNIWEEAVRMKSGAYVNKIDGALRKALSAKKVNRLTDAEIRNLRGVLSGALETSGNPEIDQLAADLRAILNDIWYELQNQDIKVGYASQYLPHVYDADKATKEPKKFKAQAKKVYDLLFEREVVDNADPDAQMADMKAIHRGLMRATQAIPDGSREPAPRLTEDQEASVLAYFAAVKELTALGKKLPKLKSDRAIEATENRIAELEAGMEDLRGEALDVLGEAWAEYSAENWLIRTRTGDMDDFGSIGPSANFLKERVLPNEAGDLMSDFMQDNPIELITNYAFSAMKKAEYARVFGADNSKLQNMLDAAEGATKEDVTMMKEAVRAATGRIQSSGSGFQAFKTTTFSLGNMSLLTLASMSSLAEPLTIGLRSGQVRDSAKALAQVLANLVRKGRRDELLEIARTIGLIMPYATDTLMQNRLGADVLNGHHWLQNNMSRFFILNGLTPLTHYQRAMMTPVAHDILLRHLRSDVKGKRGAYGFIRDNIDGERGAFAHKELNELGIPKKDRAALLKWLEDLGGMPHPDDIYGPDGQMSKSAQLWSRAVYRLSTETIQDTLKSDRPILANNPDHAAMYGIMSFIDAFTRNVIWRTLERGVKPENGKVKSGAKMTANAALALSPALVLFAGQALASIVREAIFNADAFEEKWEDDEWLEWTLWRGLDRTGLTGRLSPIINLVTGLRYETDMTSIFAGPYAAYFLNNLQDIIGVAVARNSENNNTTEYNASRAIYRAMVKPAAVALLSGLSPMGPVSVNAGRAGLAYLSARTTETGFAEALVGEKGAKHVGDPPWWEFGD